ncbi:MAG: AAA family ATPase [Lactobacillaceae bacterium]|jgi:hypothetical protein|nr:AAA family ATPase [Lactobacillaceae bacterium]
MSEELKIGLSQHVFKGGVRLFQEESVNLKNKNFIFAKNGSGKSTFGELLEKQLSSNYDVRLFQGFDELLGENDRLDAFALAVNAGENQQEIKDKEDQKNKKQTELNLLESETNEPEGIDKQNSFTKLESAKSEVKSREKDISNFYSNSAATIKNISDPQISKPSYRTNDLQYEIGSAKLLQQAEVDKLEETLKSEEKSADELNWEHVNFEGYKIVIDEILSSKVTEKIAISRLDTQDKINFAEAGINIHKHEDGAICVFCGNKIAQSTFDELESFFSANEVKQLQERITKGINKINDELDKLNLLKINDNNFYPDYIESAKEAFENIENQKKAVTDFFISVKQALSGKEKNLFVISEKLDLVLPDNVDVSEFNDVVQKNNRFGENLSTEKEKAKKKLRHHHIKELLDGFQHTLKQSELELAKSVEKEAQIAFNDKASKEKELNKEIDELTASIEELKPKAEKQAVEHINSKLTLSVPWQVDYYEDESSGYYHIVQEDDKGDKFYRGVKELSTGEKNIIAFLYFIEKLEEVKEGDNLPKIIVFDDPMNSNDDTMQYLIITQLQKLYQGNEKNKYTPGKDYFVLLTHNIHFYLNVQPHGNFVKKIQIELDNNGEPITRKNGRQKIQELKKYDLDNFYFLQNGVFHKIKNESEDFKTSYDALWNELQELVKLNLRNSMLNSMRRIIDSYIEFTKIPQQTFYRDNEQYLKLFNVNSHSATDGLSAESFTETADEMKQLFRQIFEDNGDAARIHFEAHWKEKE